MSRHEWPEPGWRAVWLRFIEKLWPWSEFARLRQLASRSWRAWNDAQDDLKKQQEHSDETRAECQAIQQNLIAGLEKLEKTIASIKADLRNRHEADRRK
jgi:hypothetical protein